MISRLATIVVATLGFSFNAFATQSIYCPQNHGYINIGMTPNQVLASCGEPLSKQQSNRPVMQKVPVVQLIYNNMGSQSAFYGVWSLPVGTNSGAQLEVDIINNQVKAVRVNGSDSNAFSICGGRMIQVGDPVGAVYGACGNPSLVNNTFINQPLQSNQRPEVWIYQTDQYQTPFSLTFVNGKLQSID
ncbi:MULTISPECIES: DUF2845 domain-containing protein [unclassified Legionella]|uniref:DUF2845 domain-containing protein n=1 Tax=unclassified Legionella TaxID=2622702 RepID=UPI0010569E47|nr:MULTISPECIES: DUF2845 domain-containing protein [unclassified Legionella]MDI9817955.1 DUF2845 domain-containing protein [Legionella sp. PL877]